MLHATPARAPSADFALAAPLTAYVVYGVTRRGGMVYFTGKAGDGWVSAQPALAMAYPTAALATLRARQHNQCFALHGITFAVTTVQGLAAPIARLAAPAAPAAPLARKAKRPRITAQTATANRLFRAYRIGGLHYVQAGQLTVSFCISRKRPPLFGLPKFTVNDLAWLDDAVYGLAGFTWGLGIIALAIAATV